MEEESVIHLFARCKFAQIVWHISPCHLDVGAIQGASLTEWWSNLLERWKGGKEDKSFWAAIGSIMWRLWICRNDVVFNNHLERPDLVCQTAIREAAEFITINAVDEQSEVAIQGDVSACKWRRPGRGIFKVNFDGGLDKNGDVGGLGMVIRDWQGKFISARAFQIKHATDPLLVEALAARESLQLALELGINNILLEGDSQQLIRLIQTQAEDHRMVGVIVADILRFLAGFSVADLAFVKRSGNGVAHNVAQRAVRGPVFSTWEFRPPLWLLSSLQRDGCPV